MYFTRVFSFHPGFGHIAWFGSLTHSEKWSILLYLEQLFELLQGIFLFLFLLLILKVLLNQAFCYTKSNNLSLSFFMLRLPCNDGHTGCNQCIKKFSMDIPEKYLSVNKWVCFVVGIIRTRYFTTVPPKP